MANHRDGPGHVGIAAGSTMKADSSTTNDGGHSIKGDLLDEMVLNYLYTSHSGTRLLLPGYTVRAASDYTGGGVGGGVYMYLGLPEESDLGTLNYGDATKWTRVNLENMSDIYPSIGNLTGSDSMAVGGQVVRNDVRSDVSSNIDNTVVIAGGDVFVLCRRCAQARAENSQMTA